MIPIPAIDLKGGKVVRLLQGKFEEEKVYFDEPDKVAKHFTEQGAARIHVVDLDGALGGTPKNMGSVEKILKKTRVPLQVGGGVRDLNTAKLYFEMGVVWVVFGTKACLDRGFLKEALAEFKDKVIVGIDASAGFVATDGWTQITKIKAQEFAKEAQKLGAKTVIYTDISKDGMLKGPSLNEIRALSSELTIDVIASGGVGTLKDLSELMALKQKNIVGVIIGKALYEEKFTLKDAIRVCSQKG